MSLRNLRVSRPIQNLGCGLLALPVLWLFAGEFFHVFASARAKGHEVTCLSNVKRITLGALQYTEDWGETTPPAAQWAALSDRTINKADAPDVWHCPESDAPFSYASNRAVGGLALKDVDAPAATVYVFERDANIWNAAGNKDLLPRVERHYGGNVYGFLDGHAKWCNAYGVKDARWQPLPAK